MKIGDKTCILRECDNLHGESARPGEPILDQRKGFVVAGVNSLDNTMSRAFAVD